MIQKIRGTQNNWKGRESIIRKCTGDNLSCNNRAELVVFKRLFRNHWKSQEPRDGPDYPSRQHCFSRSRYLMFQLPTALKKVSLPESCCNLLVCSLPSVCLKAPPENPIHLFFSTFQISPECHSLVNSNPEPWGKGNSKISFFVSPLQCRDLWRPWKTLEELGRDSSDCHTYSGPAKYSSWIRTIIITLKESLGMINIYTGEWLHLSRGIVKAKAVQG